MMTPLSRFLQTHPAVPLVAGLSDPAMQPKFVNLAPNALHPAFKYISPSNKFRILAQQTLQMTGLVDASKKPLATPVWGYGTRGGGVTWPGRTFEVQRGQAIQVTWENDLLDDNGKPLPHLLPVDTSLHWCYSLPGYTQYSIANDGVPIVTHVHGGHTAFAFDGNPEYFFSPGFTVRGPRWLSKKYLYDNDQPAGTVWYHDHALGITRLNVYAGLAGFYIIRDNLDTGLPDNPLGLPAYPYELAYAIQDRMFRSTGELFYPASEGDPFWADFITGEGVQNPPDPTALAEFFGDHIVVNGLIWPKENVEPRNYRMRLLNGCDSRFLAVQFRPVPIDATDLKKAGQPLPFYVVGSDQGLVETATLVDGHLLMGPGERYDVVIDFSQVKPGTRVILENIGGDAPFGGTVGNAVAKADLFPDRQTDRIMAFDVVLPRNNNVQDRFQPANIAVYPGNNNTVKRVRRVGLFEGRDEYGRLQPLLGVAEPSKDAAGNTVNGTLAWHAPTTENPGLNDTEIWEIYNATGDAHPIHLHLVSFEILDRQPFRADVVQQPLLEHNGKFGVGFHLENIQTYGRARLPSGVEKSPKDMVVALPGEMTRIKATFDRPGRYVWHCHILSHEDHEMMRVLHVGPGA